MLPNKNKFQNWLVTYSANFRGIAELKLTELIRLELPKDEYFFNIMHAISPQVTSLWAIVYCEHNFRIPYVLSTSWVNQQ